jgi:hypothetical protein
MSWLLDGKVACRRALKDPVDVSGRLKQVTENLRTVAHENAGAKSAFAPIVGMFSAKATSEMRTRSDLQIGWTITASKNPQHLSDGSFETVNTVEQKGPDLHP